MFVSHKTTNLTDILTRTLQNASCPTDETALSATGSFLFNFRIQFTQIIHFDQFVLVGWKPGGSSLAVNVRPYCWFLVYKSFVDY